MDPGIVLKVSWDCTRLVGFGIVYILDSMTDELRGRFSSTTSYVSLIREETQITLTIVVVDGCSYFALLLTLIFASEMGSWVQDKGLRHLNRPFHKALYRGQDPEQEVCSSQYWWPGR